MFSLYNSIKYAVADDINMWIQKLQLRTRHRPWQFVVGLVIVILCVYVYLCSENSRGSYVSDDIYQGEQLLYYLVAPIITYLNIYLMNTLNM